MITLLLTLSWLNFSIGAPVPWFLWAAAGVEVFYHFAKRDII